MKKSILTTVLLMVLIVPLSLAQEEAEQHPNFTGNWTLNEKLSDDIMQMMKDAMGDIPGGDSGGRGGGGGGGGGRGGGGGGGMGGGMGGGGGGRGGGMGGGGERGGGGGDDQSGPDSQAQKRGEEMKQQLSSLEIFQDGLELNITNGLDITRLLHTDGRTETIWTQRGEATASAQWDEEALVVEWKTRQDIKAHTRHYTLRDDGTRLTVTEMIQLPNSKESVNAKLVYDLQK